MPVEARRIGVFGGTFDPPHFGHLVVAAEAFDALDLSRLVFVPAARSPHKEQPGASPEQRLRMVAAAIEGDDRFAVDDLEIERGGASYTVDTLRALKAHEQGAELMFLLGVDQYRVFGSWRNPEEIVRLAQLAVLWRGGEMFTPQPAFPATDVPVTRIDLSSTAVRQRVATGKSSRYWVPEGVREIIEAEGLYRR